METDKRKKEEKIDKVEEKARKRDKRIDDLNRVIDRHDQYSRRNCILVTGIKESEDKDNGVAVTETLNELVQEKLTYADIDRSDRIWKLKQSKNLRLIIIRFSRNKTGNRVFKNKKR